MRKIGLCSLASTDGSDNTIYDGATFGQASVAERPVVLSLCTLRNQRRRWPRNTRYQADATPIQKLGWGRLCHAAALMSTA
jgi:hypothetical protein